MARTAAIALLLSFILITLASFSPAQSEVLNDRTSGKITGNGSSQTCSLGAQGGDTIVVLFGATQTVSTVADGGDTFTSQVSSTSTAMKTYFYTATAATSGTKNVVITLSGSGFLEAWCAAGPGFSKTAAHTTSNTGTISGNGTTSWTSSVGGFIPSSGNMVISFAVGSVCSSLSSTSFAPAPAYTSGDQISFTSGTPTSTTACSFTGTHPVTAGHNFLDVGAIAWNSSSLGHTSTLPYTLTGGAPVEGCHSAGCGGTVNPSAPWVELEADFAPGSPTDSITSSLTETVNFAKYTTTGDIVTATTNALGFGRWSYGGDTILNTELTNFGRWTFKGDTTVLGDAVGLSQWHFGGIQFWPVDNLTQASSNYYSVGFCANSTKLSFNTCGVFAQFTPNAGTTTQTISITAHIIFSGTTCTVSPSTISGDGASHQLTENINCLDTFTLPAGYAWCNSIGTNCGTSQTFQAITFNGIIKAHYYATGGSTTTSTTSSSSSSTTIPQGETTIYVKATFTGGSPSSYPSFTYYYLGSQTSIQLTSSYQSVVADTGTPWSVPSPYFSNLVNWYTNPSSGFIGIGWPYGNNYNFQYAQAPACQQTGNAWTDVLNRCYFQAFFDLYQPTIGGANAVALVLASIDSAIYFKNKHVMMAATILAVEAIIFVGVGGFGLPSWISPIGWTILALSLTAIVWNFLRRNK